MDNRIGSLGRAISLHVRLMRSSNSLDSDTTRELFAAIDSLNRDDQFHFITRQLNPDTYPDYLMHYASITGVSSSRILQLLTSTLINNLSVVLDYDSYRYQMAIVITLCGLIAQGSIKYDDAIQLLRENNLATMIYTLAFFFKGENPFFSVNEAVRDVSRRNLYIRSTLRSAAVVSESKLDELVKAYLRKFNCTKLFGYSFIMMSYFNGYIAGWELMAENAVVKACGLHQINANNLSVPGRERLRYLLSVADEV